MHPNVLTARTVKLQFSETWVWMSQLFNQKSHVYVVLLFNIYQKPSSSSVQTFAICEVVPVSAMQCHTSAISVSMMV